MRADGRIVIDAGARCVPQFEALAAQVRESIARDLAIGPVRT
jgi:hypothetical protein